MAVLLGWDSWDFRGLFFSFRFYARYIDKHCPFLSLVLTCCCGYTLLRKHASYYDIVNGKQKRYADRRQEDIRYPPPIYWHV